jgi:hypothetical protein
MKTKYNRVILRRWRSGPRSVIAFLPDSPGASPGTYKAYELAFGRVFVDVDYVAMIAQTVAADVRDQDSIALLDGLKALGMNPRVAIRRSPQPARGDIAA